MLQKLHEISNDKEKIIELIKSFAQIFQQKLKPMQFRDLFNSVEDEFFGYVIKTYSRKGSIGVVIIAETFIQIKFNP